MGQDSNDSPGGPCALAVILFFLAVSCVSACSRRARESAKASAGSSSRAPASSAPAPSSEAVPPACGDAGDAFVFVSPERPVRGQTLRVVAIIDHAIDARLTVTSADGATVSTEERHGGPPFFFVARIDAPSSGKWNATLVRGTACGSAALAAKAIVVRDRAPAPADSPFTALWVTRAAWSPSFENLYAVWIESMFEAPLDAQPSWNALHEVLRDKSRNLLFDYADAAEDEQGIAIRPDCADLPYFLRAYFAYKLGLPFGWSRCTRGENGVAPTCSDFATSSEPFPPREGKPQTLASWADPDRPRSGPWKDNAKRVGEFFRTTLADAAQSGAGRTLATDEESDYYPVSLSVETLRPGTIFADPYGHVLVVAARIAQTAGAGGILLAVDGQPDGTVARKRFWRGNFLFKRFRPIVRDKSTAKLRRLRNSELADYSATDQYAGGVEGFYDKMDDVLSPSPLDPTQALIETIVALEEQVKTRVTSVDNGRRFLATGKPAAEMPDGAKIFETTGDWEDFSTPSRDLRLLVAIDVALALPARVARRPNRYAMPPGKDVDQVSIPRAGRPKRRVHP
jgi:hypothetical protein